MSDAPSTEAESISAAAERAWVPTSGWGLNYMQFVNAALTWRADGFPDTDGDTVYVHPETGHELTRHMANYWAAKWGPFLHGFTVAWEMRSSAGAYDHPAAESLAVWLESQDKHHGANIVRNLVARLSPEPSEQRVTEHCMNDITVYCKRQKGHKGFCKAESSGEPCGDGCPGCAYCRVPATASPEVVQWSCPCCRRQYPLHHEDCRHITEDIPPHEFIPQNPEFAPDDKTCHECGQVAAHPIHSSSTKVDKP